MSSDILANESPTADLVAHYAAVLTDFKRGMTLREAEDAFGLDHGELGAAIKQGKCRFYRIGKTRHKVTPLFVGEYIETYKTCQNEILPG